MKKRVLSLLLACLMVVSTFIISKPLVNVHAVGNESSGLSFTASELYHATNMLSEAPLTFEATIMVPTTQTDRAGVIVGNYSGTDTSSICFEVHKYGHPRLVWQQGSYANDVNLIFDQVAVNTGEWLHLAIVRDIANKTAYCYVNGELKQTLTWTKDCLEVHDNYLYVGGDCRSGNGQSFKGKIKDVAVYSDVRSATEIANDVNGISYTDAGLQFAYDLTASGTARLRDLSFNRNHLIYTNSSTSVTETYTEPGLSDFSAAEVYQSKKSIGTPRTIEATIALDADATSARLGAIVGNFSDYAAGSFGLEIRDNYTLSLWWEPTGGAGKAINFTSFCETFKESRGKKIHVAVTFIDNVATLYVNGEYFDKVTATTSVDLTNDIGSIRIGGDYRANNIRYLQQAKVYSVALYSDVRSASEIAADVSAVDMKDANLLCSYDFNVTGNDRLKDYSANENHLTYKNTSTSKSEEYIGEGMFFTANDVYQTDAPLSGVPLTVESLIYMPSSLGSTRGGVIMGNYNDNGEKCASFEIYNNGQPRFYWNYGASTHSVIFDQVNVYNDCWTHLALVRDPENNTITCYVNGVAVQTKSVSSMAIESEYSVPMCIGADLRGGNAQYFKGYIRNATAYSDVRTSDEIASDAKAVAPDYNDSALIAHYDLTKTTTVGSTKAVEDLSNNANDLANRLIWFDENVDIQDYAYSFAVVGDTQIVNYRDTVNGTQNFAKIYDYIVNNVEKQNIKLVLGLGDITDRDSAAEWTLAQTHISKLNGKVPYILNRGNHDSQAQMDSYFNNEAYASQLEGTYDGSTANSYFTIKVENIKYLVMALDYGASDEALAWAAGIIESHRDYNVIITTHAYLYRDGTTLDSGDTCPPSTSGGYNDGDDIWEKLVKKHDNIVLVLSGHDPCNNIIKREEAGENGNNVVQMLIDPQGMDWSDPLGMVAMFHFSEDGKTVQVEYYSTVKEQYYHEDNQFTFTLNVIEECNHEGKWADGVCSFCGAICPGHAGGEATCQKGAVCEICGKEYTEKDPTNHVSNEFTYTVKDGVTHKVAYKCCGTEAPDGDCVYGNDYVCDYCGHDRTIEVETEDVKNAIDNILNGGNATITVVGPATTMDEAFVVEKIENVVGYEYTLFNVTFDDNDNVILRNHLIYSGELPTVTLNGNPVELKTDGCSEGVCYFDITPVAGEYDIATEVTINGDTYNVSLYSYIKLALEGTDVELTNAEGTLLRALYDLNEAMRNK